MPATLLLALLLAAAPARSPSHEALRTQCLLHAADPKNPWALAHGMTGLGKTFAAADGRLAAEVILGDYLQHSPGTAGNPYSFSQYAPDGTPIEPHPNLNVKTLVQAGYPLSTKFKTQVGTVTLGTLVDGIRRGFRHVPSSEPYWREVGWTLDLLAAVHAPGKSTFKNGAGEEVDLERVMDDALGYLERANQELLAGMDANLPEVPKRKQGIYSHSCGGMHLVQAVVSWGRFPAVRKRWAKRLDRQREVLFYRLGSETRQYQAALQAEPGYRLLLLTQMVKFYGHFLETTGRMRKDLGFKPQDEQQRKIAQAKALLDDTVRQLQQVRAFESMDQIKSSQPQVYLDLIGDACHAANGLELWR